jgi:hypothetical protein
MEVTYEFTPADMVRYQKHHARRLEQHKYLVAILSAVILLFLFADFIYSVISGSISSLKPGVLLAHFGIRLLIALALVGLIMGVLNFIGLKANSKVTSAIGRNGLFCRHKVILRENELVEMTDVNVSYYSWQSLDQVQLTDHFVLFPIKASLMFVIPRRAFHDQDHLDRFVETAHLYRESAENRFMSSYMDRFELQPGDDAGAASNSAKS